jgi:ABC-type sugar transport system ATPase subunit
VSLLTATGIRKAFGGARALDGVDFELRAGEVHALVGENGAGKSTLIRVLAGAVAPDSGQVLLDGRPLPVNDPRGVRRRGVSIVYQELTLVPELTVAENIFLGRERGWPLLQRGRMNREVQALLDEIGVAVRATTLVRGLSVGQQQMIEVARALGTSLAAGRQSAPRAQETGDRGSTDAWVGGRFLEHGQAGSDIPTAAVLVLDEPTAALAPAEVERLLAMLRRLRERGVGIIYVSHRLEEIFAVADRVTVLRDGRHVATTDAAAIDRRQLIRLMVGRDLSEEFPRRSPSPGSPVVAVRRLACAPRFTDVSFTVRAGEIVALAGLAGAGRTSTALALAGALPSEGEIRMGGRPVRFTSPADAIAAGLAYVTEDRKSLGIFPEMAVSENITVTCLRHFARAGLLSTQRERTAAAASARRFDVRAGSLQQPAATLSGGNQQKMLLARYLLEPRTLIVLDEPTRGVDVGARAEIYALMNQLTKEGLAILMISSDLPEVLGMADRIVVLREGRTAGELTRAQASAEAVMALATGGQTAA